MSDRNGKKWREAREHWEKTTLQKFIEKAPESRPEFRNLSDTPIRRIYTPEDNAPDAQDQLGFPGEYPYTRGIYPTMYRSRMWTMRQYSGFASAQETNRRYHYLLQQGQTGLSVAFDLPTQLGLDPDDPMCVGEVGKAGVSIASLEDMQTLFHSIPLDRVTTSMTINAPAAMLLAMYVAVGEAQGVPPAKLGGTVQNDIFKEYIARKNYIYPPRPALRLITDIFEYASRQMPRWNSISISGYHIREAGSTAVQEAAFTLADGMAYVEAALERGLPIDDFGPRLSFFFNSHNDFFEEIAKFRAARRMWAHTMKERYGAKDPRSWMLRFHTQTAGVSLTAQQPHNNIIRVTLQALAAVLGGTQSLHTNSMDEALALPTDHAVRIALRTQQVIAHESGVTQTIDPTAGAYYVESLTDEIEARARDYLRTIEKMGKGESPMLTGVIRGIETGYFQKEIADASYKYQREVETRDRLIVGVNEFTAEETHKTEILRVDESVREKQSDALRRLRQKRDKPRADAALQRLRRTAEGEGNLMEPILECVKAHVTVGEMCGSLKEVFGTYRETSVF